MYEETNVEPDQLLLDPNNYRFQDSGSFRVVDEKRFAEPSVQSSAATRLRGDNSTRLLKQSINANGFLPYDRIVVRPYALDTSKFVVIEGNRRVTCIKWLLADHEDGVSVRAGTLESIKTFAVFVLKKRDPATEAALMGIRHVSGIKEWGGYQRARLVSNMMDDLGLEASEVADRIGMSTQEVNRRYRAYKVLQQMEDNEEFGDQTSAEMYPLFHEAVSLPVVRNWVGWDSTAEIFTEGDNLSELYELITPSVDDEGRDRHPKITAYTQIRALRDILQDKQATKLLLDPAVAFTDAHGITQREKNLQARWADIGSAIKAMRSLSAEELKSLTSEQQQTLSQIKNVAIERISDAEKLSST